LLAVSGSKVTPNSRRTGTRRYSRRRTLSNVSDMDLEESEGTEQVATRCEECGAPLTPSELRVAMESGGPALCSVHAAEAEALPDDDV
jgi:hypothetical protein